MPSRAVRESSSTTTLIATGGSAEAATQLVEELGGQVVGYSFIVELAALQGKDKLNSDAEMDILISL
ncbi:MAG: hypothetical protein U5J63_01220 [Fodinibius sp.]|nr:hypothetical protein [Fodinibius sp.]